MPTRFTIGGLVLIGALAVATAFVFFFRPTSITPTTNTIVTDTPNVNAQTNENGATVQAAPLININTGTATTAVNANTGVTAPTNTAPVPAPVNLTVPITDFFNRVTKKPFGIYITPPTSPIQPEKFTGYHTGADAETTSAEANIDVPVYSIANGTVVFAGHVNGYGGVIIVRYLLKGETVTALYGHLRIASFTRAVGQTATKGQQIAVLGTGYSSETDGERKHLHFGIIKGATINYKGYVTAKSDLSAWEDPVAWLHQQGL